MANSSLTVDPSSMIDQEDDSSPEIPTISSNSSNFEKNESAEDSNPSLGAIFQTAYTSSTSSASSSRSTQSASASTSSTSSSTATASSATAAGPRISSEIFAPDLEAYYEDPSSQLFADDSDLEDEVDPGQLVDRGVQALFVDTSSPRRSPMPGSSAAAVASAVADAFSFVNSGPAGASGSRSGDPYSYIPSPLMTSTASL